MPVCHLIVHAIGAATCLAVIGITVTIIVTTVRQERRHARSK